MSRRTAITAIFIGAFIAVQLTLPALALFADRPARFGWQMYANFPRLPAITLVMRDGRERDLDLHAILAVPRGEIDFGREMARRLCTTDVRAIRIQSAEGSEEVPCDGEMPSS